MRVLVTGAGGFIGSHLAEALVRRGAATKAFVKYGSTGSWGWLDHSAVRSELEVVGGDVRDRDVLEKAITGVDVVFHLAALIGIPYSYRAPLSYIRTNVEGTANVLQAALATGSRVIHTSTSEVYGSARYVPIDEDHPLAAQSPYSASKIAADKLAESYYLSFGLPVVTVRPFNTFGPRQSARAVIPTIITQLLGGGEVRLGNLSPTRDFTYVEDMVEAFIRSAEEPAALGQVINFGTGREIGIPDLVSILAELTGVEATVIEERSRERPGPSEVARLCASTSRASSILGWAPKRELRSGLAETIDWIRGNLNIYRAELYVV